jgi:glycosyltransferase involved in cell wall biosynthesis
MMKETKKRVLLLIKVPPPITGATLMNKHVLGSELLKKKFKIRAIQISYAKSVKELGRYRFSKFICFMKILNRLFYECTFHRSNLVYFQISHIGIAFFRDLVFVFIIKLFNIKIVYHLHGKGIKQKTGNNIYKYFYKFAFRNSEIICLSPLLVNDIEDVYEGNIHIVNNGIPDVSNEYIISLPCKVINRKTKIIFLSNLIISKGILDFLESLRLLLSKNIDFEAVIIGAESDIGSEFLNEKLKEYKLTDIVTYLGTKYDYEKEEILFGCDILVFPTKDDVWGNVILEAMQLGKPVVATREGAIPEIVENEVTGFLVDKHSPEQIAEKLEIFINNPKLITLMGNAGRKKYLEKYTFEIFESNLKDVFVEIMNKERLN